MSEEDELLELAAELKELMGALPFRVELGLG
jgi:hypothetical protein